MANGKYYFRAADWFYPFVGAGIGLAGAVYSGGNLKGSGGGLAYQGLAGMEFRFGSGGLHLQYKYLAATTGKSDAQGKVGGGGVLAGVSFLFYSHPPLRPPGRLPSIRPDPRVPDHFTPLQDFGLYIRAVLLRRLARRIE